MRGTETWLLTDSSVLCLDVMLGMVLANVVTANGFMFDADRVLSNDGSVLLSVISCCTLTPLLDLQCISTAGIIRLVAAFAFCFNACIFSSSFL